MSETALKRGNTTYLDLVPYIIIALEHSEVVLYGNDETMSLDQRLILRACEVNTRAHRNERRFRWGVVLAETELA